MSFRKYRDGQFSEIDSQRALLDSLMGINRNNDTEKNKIKDYKDERICKDYLLGLCPHDLFGNTKLDLGPCPKFHTEEFKILFESNLNDVEYYETILEKKMLSYLTDVDKKIKRSRARLETDEQKGFQIESNPFVLKLNSDIMKLIDEMEVAGENDEIDKAMELMTTVNTLHDERKNLLSKLADEKATITKQGIDVNEKLRVCDICGAFLSIYDNDQRLIDHFIGKLHLGYQTMRNKLDEIYLRRAERKRKGYVNRNSQFQSQSQSQSNINIVVNNNNNNSNNSTSKNELTSSSLPSSSSSITNRKLGSLGLEQNISKQKTHQSNNQIEEDGEVRSNYDERKRSYSSDSSRSGSIGSLGSESSAIIRRRKRREEREVKMNEKESRKDREREQEREKDRDHHSHHKREKSYSPSRERNEKIKKKKIKIRKDEGIDK